MDLVSTYGQRATVNCGLRKDNPDGKVFGSGKLREVQRYWSDNSRSKQAIWSSVGTGGKLMMRRGTGNKLRSE